MLYRESNIRDCILKAAQRLRQTDWSAALMNQPQKMWLVGGVVRDLAHNLKPTDIDFAVADDAKAVAKQAAETLNARFVALHDRFGSYRIVLPDKTVLDFTALQGESIEHDLARRDLTINALALPWPTLDKVVDTTGGLADTANKIARRCSAGVIIADPVRTLRVFRFAAAFGLKVDDDTLTEVEQASPALINEPGERIWVELEKILNLPEAFSWLDLLDRHGVLDGLFPELANAAGVEQPDYHHLDVRDHNIETARQIDSLLGDRQFGEALQNPENRALVRLAALLHDLGKPAAASVDANGRLRFSAHTHYGAEIAEKIARRLRLSNVIRRRLVRLVEAHMRPHQLADLLADNQLTAKATRKYLLDLERDWLLCLALARADLQATCGPKAPEHGQQRSVVLVDHLISAFNERLPADDSSPLLTGNDVLELGVKPGPRVGQILDSIAQARFEIPTMTREQALSLARRLCNITDPSE